MFKENLMSALKKAADYHNSGMSDNDAVVKSAAEFDFNADQTHRLVETYNTAKTICYYKTAEDRSGTFPLANAGEVLTDLFKNIPASKTAEKVSLRDYSCYDGEIHMVESGETMLVDDFMKAASAEPDKILDEHNIRSIYKQADDYRTLARDAGISAVSADDEYWLAAGHLAEEIVKTGQAAEGLACIRAVVTPELSKAVHEDVAMYFDDEVKNAASKISFTAFDMDHPDLMEFYSTLCDVGVKRAQCAAVATTFSKMAQDMEAVVKKSVQGADEESFFSEKVKGMMLDGAQVKMAQQPQGGGKGGAGVSIFDPVRLVTQSAGKGAGGAIQDSMSAAMTEAISGNAESKALTDRAKNLHRKFILEKLITTDPVLKGLPEEDVIGAFQTLVQLAPEVSLNEDVARSILRAATNTGGAAVAPYDAKTFVDLDAAIKAQMEQTGGKKRKTEVMA